MSRSSLLVVPCSLALVVAASGCGEEALSRAEYAKQADAICAEYTKRQDALGTPKSVKDIERLAGKTKPLVEEQLGRLRALQAPDVIAGDTKAAYDLLERQLPKIDELVVAAKANDIPKIEGIAATATKLDTEANARARAAGLKVCGKPR